MHSKCYVPSGSALDKVNHHYKGPSMIPRILVIDDEADIREVTALSLETVAGWQVISAPCGAQGIQRASLEQPDAILLDVMMPDIDGPTTFHILKQNGNTAHIPVVLLTAKVQGADRRNLEALGAVAILAKPFDPLTLADQISAVLGWEWDSVAKAWPAGSGLPIRH
jgi:CheY-like chemotaxis protein